MNSNGSAQTLPAYRRLRVFALDPSMAVRLQTVDITEMVLNVPWELDRKTKTSSLQPGPIGEYLEVIDYDPASRMFYAPVDLNDLHLVAQDGLAPAEGNPQFHQQMVYAVAMTTIGHFEQALGRVALWSPRIIRRKNGTIQDVKFVRKLRIYPHALREANAYYSWRKKALLFGYFTVSEANPENVPGSTVFACLSHDVVAHETAHALLDGFHPRFMEPTNVDVLALHEAFADIVAIFQRFANPAVLYHEIERTRGDLSAENLLSKLGVQFGKAIGRGDALRDALGETDEAGRWKLKNVDARELRRTTEPHRRGAILVSAVFDAFSQIYRSRVGDLLRIAGQGTGALPNGALHPDLVQRLANEAAKSAKHILQMCIRALDYCPPIDVTFGDYLRAIVTADHDLYPEDRFAYRVAVIDAFRCRGIYPEGIGSLSQDTLRWPTGLEALADARPAKLERSDPHQEWSRWDRAVKDLGALNVDWDLESDRAETWETMKDNATIIRAWLEKGPGKRYIKTFGLTFDSNAPPTVYRNDKGIPEVEIFVRTALRRGYRDSLSTDLVVEMTQWRQGFYDAETQKRADARSGRAKKPRGDSSADGDFKFRRGCTIHLNPSNMHVRYVIGTKGNVADGNELGKVREFLTQDNPAPGNAFDAGPHDFWPDEDILQLHRSHNEDLNDG